MPGHRVPKSIFKDQEAYDRLCCLQCDLLMKDVVQPSCGHRLCQSCADEILQNNNPPLCPHSDCGEEFVDEDGAQYFPDRFIRKEIQNLELKCRFSDQGCNWEGKFSALKAHLKSCLYVSYECEHCGKNFRSEKELEKHEADCKNSERECPLAKLGCQHCQQMNKEDLNEHMSANQVEHFTIIADKILTLESNLKQQSKRQQPQPRVQTDSDEPQKKPQQKQKSRIVADGDDDETEASRWTRSPNLVSKAARVVCDGDGDDEPDGGYHTNDFVTGDGPNAGPLSLHSSKLSRSVGSKQKMDIQVEVQDPHATHSDVVPAFMQKKLQEQLGSEISKMRGDLQTFLMNELRAKNDEIASLRTTISKLERSVRSKNAESEDRDFRLSLIENSNYDGTMIWKIPQFSQRMSDASNGKYTSIFSLPFYTSRYGFKMCMRLYILGDGIGKGSHMSLFFVLMKGEFDNVNQWPFTHKVTFKLINQAGGRDVVDTFQPDPMSSSFRKPKSDMNIASGCPRFVSQSDLKNNGFIVDDTIFIKCTIDTASIRLP